MTFSSRPSSSRPSSSRRTFLQILSVGAAGLVTEYPAASAAEMLNPDGASDILLDNNENLYGPSEKVVQAIRKAVSESNLYPDRHYDDLVARIAKLHHVGEEQVVLGAGSREVLRLASCAFLNKDKKLVQAAPTYPAIEFYARSTGAEVVSDPLDKKLQHDLDAMLAHSASAGLVYVCNPNNPSASITPRGDLEVFISRLPASCYVLIDEAYHHYAITSGSYTSFLDRPLNDERVIVSRTFSHAYGLAGLRIGYGIASAGAAKRMRAFSTQDSVNTIAVRAAMAALEDTPGLSEAVKRNTDSRQEFRNWAMARSLKPWDSQTNFVMMDTFNPANLIIHHFRQNNILIAPVSLLFDTSIRVSLGKPKEMMSFWRVWDTLPIDKSSIRH
jgi:histidinol-phosphate aminotransferase